MLEINTVNNYEILQLDRCIECNKVTPTMYRIRTGFTVIGIVCQYCYNDHYKQQYNNKFATFAKPNDTAVEIGVRSLPSKSAFMRMHQNSNFLTKEDKKKRLQKKRNSKLNTEVGSMIKDSMVALYQFSTKEEIIIDGQYETIDFTNKSGEQLRCYYLKDMLGYSKPVYLMNINGKIVQYF